MFINNHIYIQFNDINIIGIRSLKYERRASVARYLFTSGIERLLTSRLSY